MSKMSGYANSYQDAQSQFSRSGEDGWRSGAGFNGTGVLSPYQQVSLQMHTGFSEASLVGGGASWNNVFQANPLPLFQGAQPETVPLTPEETSNPRARSSQKRSRTDVDILSDDVEEISDDAGCTSQGPTGVSKRTKTSLKQRNADNQGERRFRKILKLNSKIASDKAPKRGLYGPKGEVRTREDGRMEFRDVDYPEWSEYLIPFSV